MRSSAVSFLFVIVAMTMICTSCAQLHNNNQVLKISRNNYSIEGQEPRRSRLQYHRRTHQLSKQDIIDNNDNNEQRQRKTTSEASTTTAEEEEELDQNMMVDKLVYYENPYISSLTGEEVDKEEELKTDRMVDGEATGYLAYTEVSNHNSTAMLGKSGKSNNTLISRKSKSGKSTKSNSINYDQVKDPIFGKARKGKSSKKSKSSSSKGSKKSKLFGQMANGTVSPTTDTLGPKSWKGSSSEDGGTYRVYEG